ncbi:capsule biosynthesis protein [Neoroseomonas oryzicola]|uniref:Capsule biosynthesis protein n=1 Tax=Neoroseomonas oryzicola TaxID=535904 RepID=A0A9X9WNZ2_9PROT|nr:capsule biosynthesis protein [Neoroseomonas oryzicola]MBR0662052.1 capsule biosynthesis protein [Neoroseomonas oryzicola]NKE16325.1 capsule biosynthesis protein [Neoroseomonas oryzicola]
MKLSPHTTAFEPSPLGTVETWTEAAPSPPTRPRSKLWRWIVHPFTLWVLVPTALVAAYFYLLATPQYVSETRIVVRVRGETQHALGSSAVASLFGAVGAGSSAGDASTLREYLISHDAVMALQDRLDVISMWQRPEADYVARLHDTEPERLTKYFNSMVSASLDGSTGVLTLRVRSFRPEDSKAIAEALLTQAEDLVNRLSERQRSDQLRMAREEVAIAERRVADSREALARFREQQRDLDSQGTANASQQQISAMEGALTAARAELRERSAFMRPDNPALQSTRNRIEALERQIEAERLRRTGGDGTLVHQLAAYDRLMLEREFADRQLASATTSLETARMDAQRQQVFVARVVEPNLAVYPLYPRKLIGVGSVFLGLTVAFGIAWLLVASMRDHAV